MPLAGAIVMSGYWQEVDRRLRDVRHAENTEAVHDMRVAVRRLRVAFALFAPWYERQELRGLKRGLRRLGGRLGAVRDGEVLVQNARAAALRLPTADLAGLLTRWEAEHAVARVRLLDYLDEPGFSRFKHRFERFLEWYGTAATPEPLARSAGTQDGDDAGVTAHLVCDVMPAEIWRRYGAVHAYVPFVAEASLAQLHRLRIAGKRLRYAVESFEDVLGTSGKSAIALLRDLQDALGAVHDAHVAIELLDTFQTTTAGPNDRVEPYIEQQRSLLAASRGGFDRFWPSMAGGALTELVAKCAESLAGLSEDAPHASS